MMVLGLEEPLHWNKQLYALDESTRECKLSKVEDDGLNRYSFIWLGKHEERDTRHSELVREITSQRGDDPCWYLVWGLLKTLWMRHSCKPGNSNATAKVGKCIREILLLLDRKCVSWISCLVSHPRTIIAIVEMAECF